MRLPALLVAAFAVTMLHASTSSAEPARLTELRTQIHDLDARTSSVRRSAARATPQLRRESERIVAIVDDKRISLLARLELCQLLGDAVSDEDALRELDSTYHEADKLLSLVERWYRPPLDRFADAYAKRDAFRLLARLQRLAQQSSRQA